MVHQLFINRNHSTKGVVYYRIVLRMMCVGGMKQFVHCVQSQLETVELVKFGGNLANIKRCPFKS